ncbi:MAG: flagellar basal body-associated FliL family protein [Planctomycetes bacterium]|nr:flagellar basal body-associated FliL family protein [Planctomycetota bacterium]
MADNKKKDGDEKTDEAKKKGLPAIVLVAAGAALGGVGVVFAVPPKVVEVEVEQPVFELVDIEHPDVLEFTFNPVSKTGRGIASFKFQFVYTVREDREEEAFELIKEKWRQVNSNILLILSNRSMDELRTESGIRMLEKDLIDDIDRTLFPERDGEKVAKIARILWIKQLFQ